MACFLMPPIADVAARLGLTADLLEPYGHAIAKIRLEALERFPKRRGKLILVTAITPTTSGEGKTVNTIGLTQGLVKLGHKAVAALREPSLGPVFGMKGGATGGGKASLEPIDRINLHFTGDFHAITSAHNLLAALLDTHLHFGNDLRIDPKEILWPRCMDMNDRALRRIATGLGGRESGPARETGFVITAASEIMAILALADSRADLRKRLGRIVVGFSYDGKPVTAADLKAVGPMMLLLNDALMPNLVQTTEGAPAIVHCGPFANIAHGTSSVLAQRLGLHLADYVVNETGFAADLGRGEVFRSGDADVRPCALGGGRHRHVEGAPRAGRRARWPDRARLPESCAPPRQPEALGRDAGHRAQSIPWRHGRRSRSGPEVLPHAWRRGLDLRGLHERRRGDADMAAKIVAAAAASDTAKVKPIYTSDQRLEDKITDGRDDGVWRRARVIQAGGEITAQKFEALGYGKLPVCIAKTQYSFTDDPKMFGAPVGWTLTISDVSLSAGAGFVVAIAGAMMLMPGLGKVPQAQKLDIDDQGRAIGMEY